MLEILGIIGIVLLVLLVLSVLPFIFWAWLCLFNEIDDKFFAGGIRARIYNRTLKKRRKEEESD